MLGNQCGSTQFDFKGRVTITFVKVTDEKSPGFLNLLTIDITKKPFKEKN